MIRDYYLKLLYNSPLMLVFTFFSHLSSFEHTYSFLCHSNSWCTVPFHLQFHPQIKLDFTSIVNSLCFSCSASTINVNVQNKTLSIVIAPQKFLEEIPLHISLRDSKDLPRQGLFVVYVSNPRNKTMTGIEQVLGKCADESNVQRVQMFDWFSDQFILFA